AAGSQIVNHAALLDGGQRGGETDFFDFSTADRAIIDCEAGGVGAPGGVVQFFGTSQAGTATISAHGGTDAGPGQIIFNDFSSAGDSALTADGDGDAGGRIVFSGSSRGDDCQVTLSGNGRLDISQTLSLESIASLKGEGPVFLGAKNLIVGGIYTNTYSGV